MSLDRERVLLESKINGLRREREVKKMEGEMFVTQVRNELSPYLEFCEVEVEKAALAMDAIVKLRKEIDQLNREITALERRL